jgi:hypothetical protein
LERLTSSICCRSSHVPQGKRASSPQMRSFNRTRHSLCTAGHDNGQTAEKEIALVSQRRSEYRQGLRRKQDWDCVAPALMCLKKLVHRVVNGSCQLSVISGQRWRSKFQSSSTLTFDSWPPTSATKIVGPTTVPILAIRFCKSPWRWEKTSTGVVTGRSARPGLSKPGSDRQHRNRACST